MNGHRALIFVFWLAACSSVSPPAGAPPDAADGLVGDVLALQELVNVDLLSPNADIAAGDADAVSVVQADAAAQDSGAPICSCGDGSCSGDCGETPTSCPADCPLCGNGVCEPGEGPIACKVDCCGTCGDGKCKGYDCFESAETCPADCGTACGNHKCDKGESPATCAEDCHWQACGNGACEASDGGPAKCPQDCAGSCGDGSCNKGEDFVGCPLDCGYCGDGICSNNLGETSATCVADCKVGPCDPGLPSDVSACADQNGCTIDLCAPAGVCQHLPAQGDCDDGNPCTTGDHCQWGVCQLLDLLDCTDGNPCTADACHPVSGCQHVATKGACNDGNACTIGDVCASGGCAGGVALDCDDGNPCTAHACNPASGCTATPADGVCTDGDLCTTGDACAGGACVGQGIAVCDDGNPCTKDACAPLSGCSNHAAIGPCEDGNACTTGDACLGGACTAGSFVSCFDDNPCTLDSCLPTMGCQPKPATAACDDGNACTLGDACAAGLCAAGQAWLVCDDGNGCTQDSCSPATGCASLATEATVCSDGNPCTTPDACQDSACVSGADQGCDDGNACTSDSCDVPVGCVHEAQAGACDDGNACTAGDHCAGTACAASVALDCSDGDPCTNEVCNPGMGCSHLPNSGAACNDGNVCTGSDTCAGGVCEGIDIGCEDGNACTADMCANATGCAHTAAAGGCDDGDACTLADACAGFLCKGGVPMVCDDADACTSGDTCVAGACAPGAAMSCDDANPCTVDSCDVKLGCMYGDNGGALCGDFGHCAAGTCVCPGGGPVAGAHCPAILTGISVEGAELTPAFDSAVTSYATTLPMTADTAQLTVQAFAGQTVTLSINGAGVTPLVPGEPHTVDLLLGQNAVVLTANHAGQVQVYGLTIERKPTIQQAYLKASNPVAYAQTPLGILGYNRSNGVDEVSPMATSGDTVVLGLPYESCAADGSTCDPGNPQIAQNGAVHVFQRQGEAWTHQAYLKASNIWPFMHFGASVAIDGDRLVVGAVGGGYSDWCMANGVPHSSSEFSPIFIYERSNGTWTPQAVVSVPRPSSFSQYLVGNPGVAVAVSGDTIAVGGFGVARIYTRVDAAWQEQAHIDTPGAVQDFADAIALSGNTLLVGAPGEGGKVTGVDGVQGNTSAPSSGAAYVYVRNGSLWSLQAYLKASNTDAGDAFGSSVSVSGDVAVVGAPFEDGKGGAESDNTRLGAGAAYAYRRIGQKWAFDAYLKAPSADAGDGFGSAVAASGESIVIGAPGESSSSSGVGGDALNNAMPNSGAAFWFGHSASGWSLLAYLKASIPDGEDAFGSSVAIDGGTIVVDAFAEASAASGVNGGQAGNSLPGAGAAYVFRGDTCQWSQAAECDDANPCTADSCDIHQFCHHAALDGAACAAGGGVCQQQACTCPDGLSCGGGACWPIIDLTTDQGTPLFSPLSSRYHLTVPLGTSALALTATAAAPISLQLGAGNAAVPLTSGVATAPIALPIGVTELTVSAATAAGQATKALVRIERLCARQDDLIKPETVDAQDEFGSHVAMDGDTMVVGAPGEDGCSVQADGDQADNGCGPEAGAAFVYVRSSGSWALQAYLKASEVDPGGRFGTSVAISGDTIAVAAPSHGTITGAVHVFVRSGNVWTWQAKVAPPDQLAEDAYGSALALSADTLAVGAPMQDGGSTSPDGTFVLNSGTVYVYVREAGTWNWQAWVRPTVPAAGGWFGRSVALEDDTIVVGALRDTPASSGAAYVFARASGAWTQQAQLNAAVSTGSEFGASVALSGATVVIGAESTAQGPHVFVRQDGQWIQQAALGLGAYHRTSVAIAGDTLVVGDGEDNAPTVGINGDSAASSGGGGASPFANSGGAWVFVRHAGSWSQQAYIKAAVTAGGDRFGASVAIAGTTLVVGAAFADSAFGTDPADILPDAGAVYAFTVAGP